MNSILLLDHETPQKLLVPAFPVLNTGRESLQSLLELFSAVYLNQLGRAALMDRQETKYIFRDKKISNLLPELKAAYRVLEIGGLRICNYRTVYYDTPDYLFFQQHQRGAGQRWKIRQRTYLDSQQNFLEVKHKDNRKRTRKKRIETENHLDRFTKSEGRFLSANLPFPVEELHPTLEVRYTRTTLVNNDNLERITLDSRLAFDNGRDALTLDGLMIAEVKQAGYNPGSPFMAQLKTRGIRSSSFSKYCIGISLLNPEIKHNRFKPILHQVDNLLAGDKKHERIY